MRIEKKVFMQWFYGLRVNDMKKKITCEYCGRIIPKNRLDILPYTRLCVQCSDTAPYSEEDMLGFSITEQDEPERPRLETYEEEC